MDSVPIVAITGNVATSLLGKDSFQEVDIAGVTMPIVKHNWIVKDVHDLAEVVREAFIVARSGRPGPVLIDIPKDVTAATCEWTSASQDREEQENPVMRARAIRLSAKNNRTAFSEADLQLAVDLIMSAKRPFIYAGGGVIISDAAQELRALAERLNAPTGLSLMAKGALPFDHPLNTGMIGMHGTVASNRAIQKADLVIAIGARFRTASSVALINLRHTPRYSISISTPRRSIKTLNLRPGSLAMLKMCSPSSFSACRLAARASGMAKFAELKNNQSPKNEYEECRSHRNLSWRAWLRRSALMHSLQPMWGSTRCGQPNSTLWISRAPF